MVLRGEEGRVDRQLPVIRCDKALVNEKTKVLSEKTLGLILPGWVPEGLS